MVEHFNTIWYEHVNNIRLIFIIFKTKLPKKVSRGLCRDFVLH